MTSDATGSPPVDDAFLRKVLLYCDRMALTSFRAEGHLFALEEDDMGGKLRSLAADSPWSRVMFGFRKLKDGRVILAIWGNDLKGMPKELLRRFGPYLIENPDFAENDDRFQRWHDRNLGGSFEVEDGPRAHIEELLRQSNALCRQTLGKALFKFERNPRLNYPVAENNEAYFDACLELYRLIGDGLSREALSALAVRVGRELPDPAKTLGNLKSLLPFPIRAEVYQALDGLATKRNKKHGVPTGGTVPFAAFDEFHEVLVEVEAALRKVLAWAEELLGVTGAACVRREEIERYLPKIVSGPHPSAIVARVMKVEGKTIERIELGKRNSIPGLHESEAFILRFTDGSALGIDTATNAQNVSWVHGDFPPEEFHVDFWFQYLPFLTEEPSDEYEA